MSFAVLRKTIFDTNKGQLIYVGDGCVVYNCKELKHNDDVGKMFFIYSKFSIKSPIELPATFGHSRGEILGMSHKSRKLRTADDEIIAEICDEFV